MTAPRCRRRSRARRPTAATAPSRSPTTTTSAARSSSPRPAGRSGCARSPVPSSPSPTRARRRRFHLTLLVESADRLAQPLPAAHRGARRDPAGPRSRPPPPLAGARLAARRNEGLVASPAARARARSPAAGSAASRAAAEALARRLAGAFGRERLRVELQRPLLAARPRSQPLASRRSPSGSGSPCVATGNVHSHDRRRAALQDALVAVRPHTTLEESEPRRRGNSSSVLASPAEMAARFADHPEAVAETARLAERLASTSTASSATAIPVPRTPRPTARWPRSAAAGSTLRYAGTRERPEAERRLDEELRVIRGLGLSGFFLLHFDLLELAREVAAEVRGPDSARSLLPPGRGRGSSVSSVVCYLTGLSHVDPVRAGLFLGRFLNDEITEMPDIDLDFPRDIRERLIPRVHERYGRERAALVAAFASYRSRGAVRDLGKALGLPPGEIERVARDRRRLRARRGDRARHRRGDRRRARRLGALALAGAARARGLGAPTPRLPAPRRDGALDPAADRPLPGAAGGDGGAPARPVGQGLVRRRGLLEDRPARARDALRGRALRRADRRRPRRAHRPLADPARRPPTFEAIRARRDHRASSRSRAGRRCRCCPAACPRRSTTSSSRWRSCARARSRAAPCTRISSGGGCCARTPDYRDPLRAPGARADPRRHARGDRLPGPGDPGGDGAGGLFRRRGRGPAAGDEPQALRGGAERLWRALRRRRRRARRRPRAGRARLRAGARLLGLRLSEVACGRLRPARLPVDLAAGPLRAGVPLRAVQRAADGLLPARLARPRGAAPGDRGPGRGRQRSAVECTVERAATVASRRCASASATSRASPRRRCEALVTERERRRRLSRPRRSRLALGGRAATGSSGLPGPAPASRSARRRQGAAARRALAAWGRAWRRARARRSADASSRCPSRCRRRPTCARSTPGSGSSPTTPRPGSRSASTRWR